MAAVASARLGVARQSWNFARHFLEMCISMCAPGALLYLLVFTGIPAIFATGDLRAQAPELSLVIIAILVTAPMTAWMVFRGMTWRPTLEMSAVPMVLAIAIVGLTWTGVLAGTIVQIRFGQFCGLACIGMLGVMLFRLDLYTGRTGHHQTHAMSPG